MYVTETIFWDETDFQDEIDWAKDPYIAFEVAELLNLAFTDPKKFEKKAKKINDIKYDGA